jgi:NAD(P)-dependent dehydrogenase (short-subunit alcohol dehydrogenase family)
MILVTGATGNVGSALVRQLAEAGEPVRALSRSGDASKLPPGAEAAAGDLNNPESLTPALVGVRAVFLLPGYENMPETLAEIRRAGAERVVLCRAAPPGAATSPQATATTCCWISEVNATVPGPSSPRADRPAEPMARAARATARAGGRSCGCAPCAPA